MSVEDYAERRERSDRLDAMLERLEAASRVRDNALVQWRTQLFIDSHGGVDTINWEAWGDLETGPTVTPE